MTILARLPALARKAAYQKHLTRNLASIPSVTHPKLRSFIDQNVKLLKPDRVHICDGSAQETNQLISNLEKKGVLKRLDNKLRPNSFLTLTSPQDVARSEEQTFICSAKKEDAEPTNNWVAPDEMRKRMEGVMNGSMQGRTMYVIPFSMGPVGSPFSITGVQLTDSEYVVLNMGVMTRVGKKVLDNLGTNGSFVPCVHSVGAPLVNGAKDVAWPCNIEKRAIAHFPETKEIFSFGSGYGGNSLLGKKALALRIASVMGKEQGWLAEHMLILGLTNPQGKKYYVAAAFPSACGKTNLAMMKPSLPGWKVNVVGDDIAWMRFGKDGRLYAINPEYGFFGVAPGTSNKTNPNAMAAVTKNTFFTNVALTSQNDVWWEGMEKPAGFGKDITITDWKGRPWNPETSKEPAAHPNSRFTAPIQQCPVVDPEFENPQGVPISAIIFGGRRKKLVPLVFEAFSWAHGTLIGSAVASEKTAAAEGSLGSLRHDPFAMLPFCGYNMGSYFSHWLHFPSLHASPKLPKIFHVNWFRQDSNNKFLWPGFGDNSRVLKWITERIEGKENAAKTPIGYIPKEGALDLEGCDVTPQGVRELLKVDKEGYLEEVGKMKEYHGLFGEKFPKGLVEEREKLEKRLKEM